MERFKSLGSLKSFLSYASQLFGVSTLHFYILNSSGLTVGIGCRLMDAGSQVLFSFLVVLRAQKFTFGGRKSLMTVTPLFTDTARNTLHFSESYNLMISKQSWVELKTVVPRCYHEGQTERQGDRPSFNYHRCAFVYVYVRIHVHVYMWYNMYMCIHL